MHAFFLFRTLWSWGSLRVQYVKTLHADEVREVMNISHYAHTFLNVKTISLYFHFLLWCRLSWWPNVSALVFGSPDVWPYQKFVYMILVNKNHIHKFLMRRPTNKGADVGPAGYPCSKWNTTECATTEECSSPRLEHLCVDAATFRSFPTTASLPS